MARSTRRARALLCSVLLVLLGMSGCREEVESLREAFRNATRHETYEALLLEAALDETAVGQAWISAAHKALSDPVPVAPPFREVAYLPPEDPEALGYRIDLKVGQRLIATVEPEVPAGTRIFIDLYRVPDDTTDSPRHRASADSISNRLTYEPDIDGAYVLRVQPELLRGGRVGLTLVVEPLLAFPVDGRDTQAILSVYGDERDGGRRSHRGVDIFAPRGTPALASLDAVVRTVSEGGIGGKVVWLRDETRNLNLYYAHLDRQLVEEGQWVHVGDTVGLVGNTGNARSTPPHLHFGVYQRGRGRGRGATDPYPWIFRLSATPPQVLADMNRLGTWVRANQLAVSLRSGPSLRAPVVQDFPLHTAFRVTGGADQWYRVELPNGSWGYIVARLAEPAEPPLSTVTVLEDGLVRERPAVAAVPMDSLAAGSTVAVLARFEDFVLVRTARGRHGWLPSSAGTATSRVTDSQQQ